jgi:carboxyl-terminal processing protease
MNSILRLDTLMVNNRVVGHLVLKSFIEPTITELSNAFEYLYNVGAEELILDLRYNSGGRMDVTTQLASLIAKESMVGQPFIRSTYNDKNPSRNSVYAFQGTNSSEVPVPVQLDLDRLIVLTSKQTASASEAIINGLDPYLNVVLIGDDTYGKPVGMDAWLYRTYAFVPITFRLTNANDVGDYFDGIKADSFIQDDPSLDFSNRSETTLKEAIYYLKTGTFTGASGKKSQRRTDQPELQCLRDEIGAL